MRITWPFGIAAAYLAFAGSMIGFAIFTSRQPNDLVTKSYYEHATHYQENIEALQNGERSALNMRYDPLSSQLILTGDSTTTYLQGSVTFYKPDAATQDFTQAFSTGLTGGDTLDISAGHGAWNVSLDWIASERKHHRETRIFIP